MGLCISLFFIFFLVFYTSSEIFMDLLFFTVWELQIELVFTHAGRGSEYDSESELLCVPADSSQAAQISITAKGAPSISHHSLNFITRAQIESGTFSSF